MPASISKSSNPPKEKMAKFILTNKAVEDLSAIWNYTFEAWSEKQADKYYYMLLDFCQDLADGKIAGKHYPEVHEEISGVKAGRHIIFYRQLKSKNIEV